MAEASGCEAAAILLMVLSEEEASEVLSRLEPDEVQQLGTAMFGVADVSETQVEGVLDQFVDRARARTTIGFGADVQIRGMMERALGQDRAENLMARITPVQQSTALEALKWMDAPTIARLIENEHPQIARPPRPAQRRRRAATARRRGAARSGVPRRHARPGIRRCAGGA
jgi:flagellar motor switch protein FliG